MPCPCGSEPDRGRDLKAAHRVRAALRELGRFLLWPATANRSERRYRAEVCAHCRWQVRDWCGVCGCFLPLKRLGSAFRCPLGKWPGDAKFPPARPAPRTPADSAEAIRLGGSVGLYREGSGAERPLELGVDHLVSLGGGYATTYWWISGGDLILADAEHVKHVRLKKIDPSTYAGRLLRKEETATFRSQPSTPRSQSSLLSG